jgi:hypothetical protein
VNMKWRKCPCYSQLNITLLQTYSIQMGIKQSLEDSTTNDTQGVVSMVHGLRRAATEKAKALVGPTLAVYS